MNQLATQQSFEHEQTPCGLCGVVEEAGGGRDCNDRWLCEKHYLEYLGQERLF